MRKSILALSFASLALIGLATGAATADSPNPGVAAEKGFSLQKIIADIRFEYPADEIDGSDGEFEVADVRFDYPADEIDGSDGEFEVADVRFDYPADEIDSGDGQYETA